MKLTIYNTAVPVTSQEMANRLLNVCKEYGLPYWDDDLAFQIKHNTYYFGFCFGFFYCGVPNIKELQVITESEWIELLKNTEL